VTLEVKTLQEFIVGQLNLIIRRRCGNLKYKNGNRSFRRKV